MDEPRYTGSSPSLLDPFDASPAELPQSFPSISGKFAYTPSRFVCVLGTHTHKFHRAFCETYGPIYGRHDWRDDGRSRPRTADKSVAKFGLDFNKPDPWNLVARQREYALPSGCVALWSTRLLHGQVRTPLDEPTEYGCYVGFQRAGSRPRYAEVCGVDELDDRLRSYTLGVAPTLWPSFDRTWFYPYRFRNFGNMLVKSVFDRLPPGHPSIATRTTHGGKVVPHLLEWQREGEYVPPELSSLGKKLLGLDAWE